MSVLTLISLPIGNVEDITFRAKKKIIESNYFLAEDTRVFKKLLGQLNIEYSDKIINSFHDHSDDTKSNKYLNILNEGIDICLVSDAGSPVISDPGYGLVAKAIEGEHTIETCSGVSSVTTALELCGLPPYPFFFYGFIPRENGKKESFLLDKLGLSGTHIFFEAPTRVLKTLKQMSSVCPDVDVAVCRELTKTYESVYRFKSSEFENFKDNIITKGEFVILFNVAKENVTSNAVSKNVVEMVNDYIENGGSSKKLAKIFSEVTGKKTKEVYDLINRR